MKLWSKLETTKFFEIEAAVKATERHREIHTLQEQMKNAAKIAGQKAEEKVAREKNSLRRRIVKLDQVAHAQ